MGMSVGGGAGLNSEPNVVPMIDILLVLLIIFMVAQPLSRTTHRVQVAPPVTGPTPPSTENSQIVLELTADGGYAINQQPYPKNQLEQAFHTIFDPRPAKLLFVKPALNRKYQEVVEAMDIAKGAGIQIIGFTPKEAYK